MFGYPSNYRYGAVRSGYPLGGGDNFDADASAFFTAAGITDATQKTAINDLVVAMKADGIWSKMHAIYPFVGGTAGTHKWNLKDPQDTDAAFRLTFTGGWTHSADGAKPNGTTGYADTFWNPTTELADNTHSMGVYITVGSTLFNDKYAMGAHTGASNFHAIVLEDPGSAPGVLHVSFSTATRVGRDVSAGAVGFIQGISDGVDHQCLYGSSASSAVAIGGNRANANFYLGALNLSGLYGPMDGTLGFAYMGEELSQAEALLLNTAVQDFQTALSREV